MLGLTPLGSFHTVISLIAVASGAISLIKFHNIKLTTQIGKTYIITTIIVCLTGFGIFQHGGFGIAHILSIITLLVLGIALLASKNKHLFGKLSEYVSTLAFTFTFLLHLIPGINESMTRLPLGKYTASGPDDPIIKMSIGVCFILFLITVTLQLRFILRSNKNK